VNLHNALMEFFNRETLDKEHLVPWLQSITAPSSVAG
jgi:hypothetical protein